MSASPPVSVIIPIGRYDPMLERQLRAVCQQHTSFDFAVIVSVNTADRGDRSAIDACLRGNADARVRVVDSSDRKGAAHARNVGAARTSSELLAFCDADDEVQPGWLSALVRELSTTDAVTGSVVEFAPEAQSTWRPPATPGRLPTFLGHPYLLSGTLAIHRQAFEHVGGFDETLTRCEDIAISWKLLKHGYRIGFVDDAVLHYHHRSGLWNMMRQHYQYGRGMSEVAVRYMRHKESKRDFAAMKPNAQPHVRNAANYLRRASIAVGRAHGIMREQLNDAQHRQSVIGDTTPRTRIAYMLTHYPELTHTFIAREIDTLRESGLEVITIAMNAAREASLVSPRDFHDRDATFVLKTQRKTAVLATIVRAFRRSPRAFVATLFTATRNTDFNVRVLTWRCFHFVEALMVWDHCVRQNARHVHAHFGLTPATIAWFACEFSRRVDDDPLTWSFTIHGFHDFVNEKETDLAHKAAAADFVVCVSDFTRSQLMRVAAPQHWPRFHVIRCGIDIEEFAFRSRGEMSQPPRVAVVARLSPEKGHVILLEAVALLCARDMPVRLDLIGGGPFAEQVRLEAARLGIADLVELRGALPSESIESCLREDDIFCLPSFAEGLPVSIMEAMAVGLPVITTFISGIPELAEPGETALVVPAGSAESLADALQELLSSPSLRERLAKQARDRIEEQYVLRRNVDQLRQLFVQVTR